MKLEILNFRPIDPNSDSNYWLFTFWKKMRELLNHLNNNKTHSRPFWTPINNLPFYGYSILCIDNEELNKLSKKIKKRP